GSRTCCRNPGSERPAYTLATRTGLTQDTAARPVSCYAFRIRKSGQLVAQRLPFLDVARNCSRAKWRNRKRRSSTAKSDLTRSILCLPTLVPGQPVAAERTLR